MKMRNAVLPISSAFVVTVLGVAALLAVSTISAQTTEKGSINGTLVDVQGAPVAGATVTATRQGGGSVAVKTNEDGLFRIADLDPGNYTVTIEGVPGYGTVVQQNVSVNAGKPASVALELKPTGANETVQVTARSEAATESTPATLQIEASLANRGVQDLSSTRNFVQLARIETGIPSSITGETSTSTNPSFTTVRFDAQAGTIWVYLPNDIRSGDTVSGTLTAERTANNKAAPKLEPQRFRLEIPVDFRGLMVKLADSSKAVSSTEIKPPNLAFTPRYNFDRTRPEVMGQQGRPVEIWGPFDGNFDNTFLSFGPNGSGLGGKPLILSESPRRIVFHGPTDFTGPVEMTLKERDAVITGSYRNVGVRLSAPKTNLMRGERTTLTIEVTGLKGIIRDVPLQLDARGVITMEGGNFQNLRIKPEEVTVDGRYTTNRTVTGQQAGGFSVTATVIVAPFDFVLQDDSDPNRIFHFNSFTGDYSFACGGGSCPGSAGGTSDQPSAGSSAPPTPFNLTGIGTMQMKGCIITLTHNAPDRRVFARLDTCTKGGDASIETTSPKTKFNLTDKNTADNTAPSPPPK